VRNKGSHQREWRRKKNNQFILCKSVQKSYLEENVLFLFSYIGILFVVYLKYPLTFVIHLVGWLVKRILFCWSLKSPRELVLYPLIIISGSFYWIKSCGFFLHIEVSHVKSFGVCWFLPSLFYAFCYFAYYLFREDLIWILLLLGYLLFF